MSSFEFETSGGG
jgi:hypothetical protein